MSLDNVTEAAIRAASFHTDLDQAALELQELAGITDGGVASICLPSPEIWKQLDLAAREATLRSWIEVERNYARWSL